MGYGLTKMEDLQIALMSQLFGVFASGFCTEQLYTFRKIISACFCEKKVEYNLPILHGF